MVSEENISQAKEWIPPQWWLISNESVEQLRQELEALPKDTGEAALHVLHSSLFSCNVAPAEMAILLDPMPEGEA